VSHSFWSGEVHRGLMVDRQNDLKDALDSLRGKELKISTDPDTSITLERLLPSLGDWGRRVVGDSFGTQWELLLKNRFGSHIVQTWLTLAADTLDRESRGIFPPQQEEQNEEEGVLPKMSELIRGLVSSIEENLAFMLVNPFASPVLRLLWLVLTPGRSLPGLEDGEGDERIRSKRSNKYRKGQGVGGKTIFGESSVEGEGKGKGKGKEEVGRRLDKELAGLRERMRKGLMEKLSGAEWRMLGVNPVGCVTVQVCPSWPGLVLYRIVIAHQC
jgi:nucleolar protein 9